MLDNSYESVRHACKSCGGKKSSKTNVRKGGGKKNTVKLPKKYGGKRG